jgi:NitT/TauT family transport system permease protein
MGFHSAQRRCAGGDLIGLASLIWVPIGVAIGLRPHLADRVQPIVQFLAAFPANLFFPVAVVLILRFRLNPQIWLSPLMILGTQWYILFNVIVGTTALPLELQRVAQNLGVRRLLWWRRVILPAIFPAYVTGAVTAAGGSWNASIVSEVVQWGDITLTATGIGAYIARTTAEGDSAHRARHQCPLPLCARFQPAAVAPALRSRRRALAPRLMSHIGRGNPR